MEERPTDGAPDMMSKGTGDSPPQKESRNMPERTEEEQPKVPEKKENEEVPEKIPKEVPGMPKRPNPNIDIIDYYG